MIGEASDRTKTKTRLRIPLPKPLLEILEDHVKRLPASRSSKSDLLFPSKTGGYQTASILVKPIEAIAAALKIKKHLSPYFMRRTFQDLCRAAQVHDFVARAISGHATVEMQQLYSTVDGSEVRAGLAKVISLAGFKEAHQGPVGTENGEEEGSGGDRGGDREPTERRRSLATP